MSTLRDAEFVACDICGAVAIKSRVLHSDGRGATGRWSVPAGWTSAGARDVCDVVDPAHDRARAAAQGVR